METGRTLVCGRDAEDAVGVNVELDLHLGGATWRTGDAIQPEVAQRLVVLHKLPLTLQGGDKGPCHVIINTEIGDTGCNNGGHRVTERHTVATRA